jgi:hypothetical protein
LKRVVQADAPTRRAWTEDELAILYWSLPIMRTIGELTGRQFPALAMKLANLLAVESDGHEGLANVSALDRAIVARYRGRRTELEGKVVQLLSNRTVTRDRSLEIRNAAVEILRSNGIPLHSETIGSLLAARNPLFIASSHQVRETLRTTEYVTELADGVFAYYGTESREPT